MVRLRLTRAAIRVSSSALPRWRGSLTSLGLGALVRRSYARSIDEPAALARLAAEVATEAGALVAASAGRVTVAATKSTATDLVTEVDRATERLIIGRLSALRAGDGFLGEEHGAVEGSSGVRWVIDPIDGTTNFVYGLPAFAVSIAAEVDGRVVAGAVADPSRGEVFTAWAGGGAWLGAQHLRVPVAAPLDRALVGTGFSYSAPRRAHQAAVLTTVLPAVRDIRRSGSAALDLCWVASGRIDAYYERGLGPWDHAAGALIAAEAGATVGGLPGSGPSEQLVMAAAPGLFEQLSDLLDVAGAFSVQPG